MCIKKTILFLLIISTATGVVKTQEMKKEIRVGFEVMPPFVVMKNGEYSGVSIDLWKQVADSLDLEYSFVEYDLQNLLESVKSSDIDIAISPLAVTSTRIKEFGFSQPYYITNMAFATKVEGDNNFLVLLRNIFSINFLKAIGPMFFIIFVFGLLIWVLERKKNKSQFRKGYTGLKDGFWWSAVTMSTVGYGDKAPITLYGRIVAIIWMFTAVIMISGLTASISSSLTVHRLKAEISNFDDLRKTKVGCIPNSGTSDILNRYNVRFSNYNNVESGLEAVSKGEIDAFVYDDAVLNYFVKVKHHHDLKVVPSFYAKEYFSFASINKQLLHEVNPMILSIIESDEWELNLKKYNIEYRK